jgi:riboflavin synthase
MFTGIIEEIGKIKSIQPISNGILLTISASFVNEDLKPGDSISVNGVCLTVKHLTAQSFFTEAVGETLKKTNIAKLKINEEVNLERAIRLSDRLGGHLVQGHINATGAIIDFIRKGENYSLVIEIPSTISKYVVSEGSITIDGISLTIASTIDNKITISIIPFTYQNTILKNKRPGDLVNIETDVIAKYIEKLVDFKNKDKFSENWLKELGY